MACRWGSTSRVRRAGKPSCRQDVETRPDTSMRRHRGRGNAYIVSFLPGMTTSQFRRSVDPSALLRGRATKPMGWSLRQLRRSSRRRPSAMPAISLVRRGLRGAAGGSRRVGRAGSERASAAVVATVPVAVLPSHTGPGGSARKIELAQYWEQRWLLLCLARTSTGRRGRFFGRQAWTIPAQYVLAPVSGLLCLELGADFGESVTARPALIRRRPECARRRQR